MTNRCSNLVSDTASSALYESLYKLKHMQDLTFHNCSLTIIEMRALVAPLSIRLCFEIQGNWAGVMQS